MADILNAVVVWDKGSSGDRDRISPVTTSCWGGNPFSLDGMKDKAEDLGTSYSGVSSVDVTIGNNGRTTQVKLSTDKGSVTIDGEKFKTVFNLRAPGYISIKNRLYEVIKK
jgi:carbonic anhydrase